MQQGCRSLEDCLATFSSAPIYSSFPKPISMNIILLLVGLCLLVAGASFLVDGASSIARKAGISEFVIGLTIVGFGTSCPELVVSLNGAIQGNSEIAIGNVIGSNIFNILLILGITALIAPVQMTRESRRKDIPIMLIVSVLLIVCGMGSMIFGGEGPGYVSRPEALLFLAIFASYLIHSFKTGKASAEDECEGQKNMKLPVAIILVIAGLAGLIFGGNLLVNSATQLARQLGVSDKLIAFTVLAGGTSLPELAASVTAALKGKHQLALGNIVGSNIFNILFILGCSGLITPLSFASITYIDVIALLVSGLMLLLWAFTGRKDRIDRWEGLVMLIAYGVYCYFLFNRL